MKERALYLHERWKAEALGVSTRSIERREENCIQTHGYVKPPRSIIGRPKLLTADTVENIQKLLRKGPILLDEIKEWLAFHNQPISTTALHMNLQDLAPAYERLERVASERDDAYRTEWVLNMTSRGAAQVWPRPQCTGPCPPCLSQSWSSIQHLSCSFAQWLHSCEGHRRLD